MVNCREFNKVAEDNTTPSIMIQKTNGKEKIRNKTHVKRAIKQRITLGEAEGIIEWEVVEKKADSA